MNEELEQALSRIDTLEEVVSAQSDAIKALVQLCPFSSTTYAALRRVEMKTEAMNGK